jgi:lipopolysaccharide export LptBFGC system permease protein LptF
MHRLPFTSRLDSYIGKQLFGFLSITLLLITLVVFFSDTLFDFLRELQQLGIPLGLSLQFLALSLPDALVFAIAPSVFLTCLLIYNQLNAQFELVALRMVGISLGRLVRPALVLGGCMALITFWLMNSVVPDCHRQLTLMKKQMVETSRLTLGKNGLTIPVYGNLSVDNGNDNPTENQRVNNPLDAMGDKQEKPLRLEKLLYAELASAEALQNVTYLDVSDPKQIQLLQAATAKPTQETWIMHDVQSYILNKERQTLVHSHMGRMARQYLLNPAEQIEQAKETIDTKGLNFTQLQAYLTQPKTSTNAPRKLYLKLWDFWVQPLSCIALALLALPLSLAPPRQAQQRGFTYGILVLFLLFLGKAILTTLGLAGVLQGLFHMSNSVAMGISAFLPVVSLLVLALVLLSRKSKML